LHNGGYRYPDVLSYWTISDCFDEWWGNNSNSYIEGNKNVPFGQVFGLINYQGIRKAAFNAFAMLHKMGTIGLQLTGGSGDADGVDGFATVNADSSQVTILVYSYYNDLTTTGSDNIANLTINNLPFANGRQLTVNHYRVDSLHSNPYAVWLRLNSPASPSTGAMGFSPRPPEPRNDRTAINHSIYRGPDFQGFCNAPLVGLAAHHHRRSDRNEGQGGQRPESALFSLHGT
jgi:hypothetical protein